ncbi:energy transducer TonB [Flavobacterium sp. 2]|uniref:energy transducer TonB n=1 Tax=Flavobacterium sp. 2 TaxID=308053 RepID=UPI000C17BF42|nr:energy transducer TonB [Flavobacterium sp. 2]PIF71804.1 TonB-like protein [Flavobacterium sp. 2]
MQKLLILILICFTQSIFSQNKEVKTKPDDLRDNLKNYKEEEIIPEENQVYNVAGVEARPEFPGGPEGLNAYIKQNYNNPQPGLTGKVYVTFIIEKDGSLGNIQILRDLDLGHETGAEARRVLQNAPKWTPGKQNNKIVRVLYSMPVIVE